MHVAFARRKYQFTPALRNAAAEIPYQRNFPGESPMPWSSLLAVGLGAALGAWLRWGLGLWLNPLVVNLPLGTLAANLAGGLLMGLLMALLEAPTQWPAELRLFAGTGFLGGLTTFSTFSGETSALLDRGEYTWAGALVLLHVLGSVAATLAGWLLLRAVLRSSL
jgi:CrcB protein